MPGQNSCKRLIPASLPIVDPKSLKGAPFGRIQYGREALWAATELSTLRKIRSVQPPLSELVTRDKNSRSCISGPAHNAAAGRRVIAQVRLEQRWIQVLTNRVA